VELKSAFGKALREARTAKGLTQEAFSDVSSRTYLSALERGLKNPTIDKVSELAEVVGMHPLSLLALCFLYAEPDLDLVELISKVHMDFRKLEPH